MLRFLIAFLALCLAAGCARSPEGGGGVFTKRIRVWIRLAAPVNPDYIYIVAFNDANDPTGVAGPQPVIAPPWGNGFVAGAATHFVRYDGFLPNGGYGVFRFTDPSLLTWFQTGIPVAFVTPGPNDNLLEFEIDATQLRPDQAQALQLLYLQVNLLTMDIAPSDPNYPGPKFWDALGDSRLPGSINDYITIDLSTSRFYRNSELQIEPEGDTPDPSLDIVDWFIEIRTR